MWKPIYQPEPWPQFVKRKDIKGLPLMEQRKKFLQEQLLFENYLSTLNTVNTVSTAAAGAAGGPAPGGGIPEIPIRFKIDTNYNWQPGEWGFRNPQFDATTKVAVCTGVGVSNSTLEYTPFEVTIDWGDGEVETFNAPNTQLQGESGGRFQAISHSYAEDGEYELTFSGFSKFDTKIGALPIVDVISYPINERLNSFNGLKTINYLFNQANWSGYNPSSGNDISSWDVSKIEDFGFVFTGYNAFMPDNFSSGSFVYPLPNVENWDVSSGESFFGMFIGQANFSQSLGTWDVSNSNGFNYMFEDCVNLVSGARADLWDVGKALSNPQWYSSFWRTFHGSMTTPAARGSMPHVGNWDISGITPGISNLFFFCWDSSGFSHTAIGETLIGWASQSVIPENVGIASSAFSNTWDGSGFSNPSYDTGSAFGLEVSASYDYLVTTKGWTIPNFTFS